MKNEALQFKVFSFLRIFRAGPRPSSIRAFRPAVLKRPDKIGRGLLSFLIILSLAFFPGLQARAEMKFLNPELKISMDLQNANLKDILKVFSIQSGLNFVASEAVQDRTFTLYMEGVPIKEALEKIFKANNLSYDLDTEARIFIVKDMGKPAVETITQVFTLKNAMVGISALKTEKSSAGLPSSSSAGVSDSIKKLLSPYGSLVEDPRTNSLIITDIPSKMSVIAKTIEALDISLPEVLIEVEMLDVSKNLIDKIGVKYGTTPFTMVWTGPKVSGIEFPYTPSYYTNRSVAKAFTPGSLDFSSASYTVLLDFLKTQADTRYLARPRIRTLNNETAEIKIATDEAVGISTATTVGSASTNAASAERVATGVTLRVTPQINMEAGEITMFIFPTVKDASTSVFFNQIGNAGTAQYFKDPEERSTKTTVRIKDGETIIVGGLIRKERTETITKLPFLGDLPFIGSAFRHRDKSKDKERELLVFITPRIIKDTPAMALAQSKKAALPEREQSGMDSRKRDSLIDLNLDKLIGSSD